MTVTSVMNDWQRISEIFFAMLMDGMYPDGIDDHEEEAEGLWNKVVNRYVGAHAGSVGDGHRSAPQRREEPTLTPSASYQLIDAGTEIMQELRSLVDTEDEEQANRVIPKMCSWILAVSNIKENQ